MGNYELRKRVNISDINGIQIMEMEVTNLLITKNGQMVSDLLKSYSTSEDERHKLISQLLDFSDTGSAWDIDIKTDKNRKSINRTFLDKYLDVLDLKIEDE